MHRSDRVRNGLKKDFKISFAIKGMYLLKFKKDHHAMS